MGSPESIRAVEHVSSNSRIRVAGFIIDTVDKILHGMELGTAGMHNQVRQWATQGFLRGMIGLLIDRGFRVFLTSDHGNVEGKGCGRPAEGAIAETKGQRVRVYTNSVLRSQVKARFPESVEWPPIGLPEDYLPLLASGRTVFASAGESSVSHGGSSLEEVVVPFIELAKTMP
jgi:hypothetical protein